MLVSDDRDVGKEMHGVIVRRAADDDGCRKFIGTVYADGGNVSYWGSDATSVVRSCRSYLGMPFRHINKENVNSKNG